VNSAGLEWFRTTLDPDQLAVFERLSSNTITLALIEEIIAGGLNLGIRQVLDFCMPESSRVSYLERQRINYDHWVSAFRRSCGLRSPRFERELEQANQSYNQKTAEAYFVAYAQSARKES
jgi:hypothetical protein